MTSDVKTTIGITRFKIKRVDFAPKLFFIFNYFSLTVVFYTKKEHKKRICIYYNLEND